MTGVVADSTPLNYLAVLSDFELLRLLYGRIVIPPAVYEEVVINAKAYPVHVAVTNALGNWMEIGSPPAPAQVRSLMQAHDLEKGECEAIVIAGEFATPLLMDEQDAVLHARGAGITVIRTPMIYAEAKLHGLIRSVGEKLNELRDNGFWLTPQHYESILKKVGEA
jgi:predicted nucleic acid-binding protein